jgi:hypothetical protein
MVLGSSQGTNFLVLLVFSVWWLAGCLSLFVLVCQKVSARRSLLNYGLLFN